MFRINLFAIFPLILGCPTAVNASDHSTDVVDVIAFGSCVHQDHEQPIWKAINAENADLFVLLGDNIYGDTEDMAVLQAKYQKLGSNAGFQQLRASTPLVAVWDDHDFGRNDGGGAYPKKAASRQIMLDFFEEPADSPRRTQEGGIYTSYEYGPPGQRVQLILLDLRWNRGTLERVGAVQNQTTRVPRRMGPYKAHKDDKQPFLGEAQWRWLEAQLEKPADIRIIGSSLQFIPEFTGWESWANFPHARNRLLKLLRDKETTGAVVISGDTHWSEFSRLEREDTYPLTEVTSSGLTEEWRWVSPNKHRVGEPYSKANYGLIKIDWAGDATRIHLSVRDVTGQVVREQTLALSQLQ